MLLSKIEVNKEIVIKEINFSGTKKQRLIDLGFLKGAKIKIKRYAPLGDPMVVEVNDCEIAIRRRDADNIIIA